MPVTERIRRYAYLALGLTLLVAAILNWVTTFEELRRFYINIPIWDAFDWVSHFSRYQHFDWSVLWLQHNEHREIGTELLFAIDMLLFEGRQILPTVAGVAAYIGVLVLFAAFGYRYSEDKASAVCAALMIATLAGYKLCVVSLTIPFLTSWPQWEFFGVATLAAAVLHSRRGGKLMLIVSIACAVAATYSMSNGMLVWPVLLAVALLLRFTRQQLAAIIVCGAASILAYFYHYTNLHSLAIGVALKHPLYLAGFLGSFLGMPFSAVEGISNPWHANIYGWLALSIAAADLVCIVRRRLFTASPVIVMGGFCILVFASTLATAMGRMNPDDPYFQAARAGRYITEPILFWCALVMLSVWLLRSAWKGYAALLFVSAMAILSARTLPQTTVYYAWWNSYFQSGQSAEIAAANGVIDSDVSAELFPGSQFVAQYEPVLVQNHLAIFAGAEPGWIGRPWSKIFQRGPGGVIHGAVTKVKKRGADYEVQGWADGATRVVFTDDTGRIVGFGMHPKAGVMELYTNDVPPQMAFTGFIRGAFGARQFAVWAVDKRGQRISRISQAMTLLP